MKIPKITNFDTTKFVSFDGSIKINSHCQFPNNFHDLKQIPNNLPRIGRGGGYSYSAPSFGKNILTQDIRSFDKILEYDEKAKTVVVESGITLKKLLNWSFGKKLFLKIQPGHPDITIGGCIASNVHGKNPYKDGDFIHTVLEIKLYHPEHGIMILNRNQNSEIFELTCGGFGLTGIILNAKIQLDTLPSDRMIFERIPVDSLMDTVKLFQKNLDVDFISSWHNGSSSKKFFGKGIAYRGIFADNFQSNKLILPNKGALTSLSRARLPFSIWNKITAPIVYSFYRYREINSPKSYEKNIFDSLFPFAGNAKYYHLFYGKNGLVEYQILVDFNKVEEFIKDLTKLIKIEQPPLILIFLKPFRGNQKYLRYSGSGISFALNFQRSPITSNFLSKLDDILISYGAILHVIKNPSKRVVQTCFPEYSKFVEDLKKFDPKRIYKSDLSEKLDL
jgi:decaprenylphospho-beta-D-ribofuranose 2-oxidase